MNITAEVIKIAPTREDAVDYGKVIFRVDFIKRVDIDSSYDFWVFMKTLVDGGAQKIIGNMKVVEYVDSSGIGVLINAAKLARKNNGDIVLAHVFPEVKDIFKIINLQNFIKVFNTEVEAIEHFRYVK